MNTFSTSTSPTNALPLTTLLKRHQVCSQLNAGIEQAIALKRDLAALLPDYLIPNVSTGPIKKNILVLFTTHHAFATRLRHLTPSLLQHIQQRGWSVQALKIRVQPHNIKVQPTPPKKARLSTVGLTHLQRLCEQLPSSPLQTAIARLVARHTAGTG